MCNKKVLLKGLLIAGLVGMLCTCGLGAERPGEKSPGAPAQERSGTQQTPGTQPTPGTPQTPGTQPIPGTQQTPGMRQQMPGMQQPRSQADQAMMLHRASKLIGKEVKNRQGEDLGNVHDLVLTPDLQQVSYVALARGGVWGMGAELFAIPWQAIQTTAADEIQVTITKQQLEAATGFDRDNWPAQADMRWTSGAMGRGQTFERQTPMGQQRDQTGRTTTDPSARQQTEQGQQRPGQTTERAPLVQQDRGVGRGTAAPRDQAGERETAAANQEIQSRRVTNLIGMNVRNDAGEDIADIEDFVIEARQGRIAYTVVSFGGFWGIGEKYAAVPHTAIQLQPRRNIARLDADRQTLEGVAFEAREFPDLSNREYAQRLHEAFKAEPYWIAYGYVPAQEQQAASEKAWGAQGEYAKHFDAQNVKTIKGTVQSVGSFRPDEDVPGISGGLRLRVATEDGNIVTVHAGPQFYAQQQDFFLKPGDEITVTGCETKIGWRSVFMASEIKKGDQTLQLRDKTGQPQWKSQGQQMQQRQQSQPMPQRQQDQQGLGRQPGAAGQRQPQPGQQRQQSSPTPQ